MTHRTLFSSVQIAYYTVSCGGCKEDIDLETNQNVVLTGNANSIDGMPCLSPVFNIYHAPCWLKAAKKKTS